MAIVSLDEAKAQLNISDGRDDDELTTYLEALTPVIERETGQVIVPRDCVDEIEVYHSRSVTLTRVPVLSVTSVARLDFDQYAWDVSTLHINAATGKVTTFVVTRPLDGYLTINYRAGYETVPDNIKRGALVILQHAWELQRGVGTTPAAAVTSEGWVPQLGFTIPNRAREWLGAPMPGVP